MGGNRRNGREPQGTAESYVIDIRERDIVPLVTASCHFIIRQDLTPRTVTSVNQVIVWNAATKQIRYTNTGFHTMGIAYLAWSPGGNMLASVGADELHSLEIVEASSSPAAPLFRVRYGTHNNTTLEVKFPPPRDNRN